MSSNSEVKEVKETYTMRMCLQFENSLVLKYSGAQVREMIQDFSLAEFNQKKANSSKFSFGKYKGKSVASVALFDKPYLLWLIDQEMMNDKFPDLLKNIKKTLKLSD